MLNLSSLSLILLALHFLGDYQLQSPNLATSKLVNRKHVFRHLFVHFGLHFCVWILLLRQGEGLPGLLLISILWLFHLAIDLGKIALLHQTRRAKISRLTFPDADLFVYLLDQLLHVAMILIAVELIYLGNDNYTGNIGIPSEWVRRFLVLILITKPANVTFKICFAKYQLKEPAALNSDCGPNAQKQTRDPIGIETEPGAGAMIGNLERIISALFWAAGQYAAIGLIYTAKSIARYKQIEENKRFAEYYLIGTLYSILYVLVICFALLTPGT